MNIDKIRERINDAYNMNEVTISVLDAYHLLLEVDRLTKERDAAVADLGSNCFGCVHWETYGPKCEMGDRNDNNRRCKNYKWRGLTEAAKVHTHHTPAKVATQDTPSAK